MAKKEILEIFNYAPGKLQGGIQHHINNLCELFSFDNDYQVTRMSAIKFIYIKLIRKRIYSFSALKKELLKKNYSYIHVHGITDIIAWQTLKIASKYKLRIIYAPHFHPFTALGHPWQGRIFFHFFIKKYLKYISKIETINNEENRYFKKYSKKVFTIPHWAHKNDVVITHQKIKNRLLFIGRMESNKGIEHLYHLDKNKYDIHCVIPDNILKDFIIHSNVSDDELQYLYQSSSLVIVPSRYESFSLVSLEALVNGTPILISENVRIADYLDNVSGVTIFKYGNFSDFIGKVDFAMNQKVDREAILEIFSKEKAKKAYKELFS
jgi:glycosyltransferase involved in cell wall biosynthesis